MGHIVRLLSVLALFGLAEIASAACTEGQIVACYSGGVGGLQVCSNGVLGPCVVPPSACGGVRPYGSVLQSVPDGGSNALSGLLCGAGNGSNKTCYSCSAQWVYPGNGTAECRCI